MIEKSSLQMVEVNDSRLEGKAGREGPSEDGFLVELDDEAIPRTGELATFSQSGR